MDKIVIPRVPVSEKKIVKEFMTAIETSFSNMTSEGKFDKELKKADLIAPIERCAMFTNTTIHKKKPNESELNNEENVEEGTTILMPLIFQMKKFFELPGVLQKVIDNQTNIQRSGKLNHFINGSLWKQKIKNFEEGSIVIPYHYYSDAAQLNHPLGPLGPHCRQGQEDFHYYSFPTIPSAYQSRLENIFLAYLFPGL